MHKLKDRTYVGAPSETVTVTLTPNDGGQASAKLNGALLAGDCFPLPPYIREPGELVLLGGRMRLLSSQGSADPRRAATRKVRSDCEA